MEGTTISVLGLPGTSAPQMLVSPMAFLIAATFG